MDSLTQKAGPGAHDQLLSDGDHAGVQRAPSPAKTAANQEAGDAAARRMADQGAKPAANFDAVLELMGHRLAYEEPTNEDVEFLRVNGYTAGPLLRGKLALMMRVYHPIVAGKPPVIAFRGTQPKEIETLLTDADPTGVGWSQYIVNRDLIHSTIAQAMSGGPGIAVGHSLGGALAQIAVCRWPEFFSRIVTFQSPGIDKSLVDTLEAYNAAHPGKAITSEHNRIEGDLIPGAGQKLTPGVINNYKLKGGNAYTDHLAEPVETVERERGNKVPSGSPQNDGKIVFDKSERTENERRPGWVEPTRELVGEKIQNDPKIQLALMLLRLANGS
jgi:hypothetical protein